MKELAVIGDSNSLMRKGYVSFLKEFYGDECDSYSIGATTSINFLFALIKEELANRYKNIIFDGCINDTSSIYYHMESLWRIIAYNICALSMFKYSSSHPVFLILPTLLYAPSISIIAGSP